MNRDYYDGIKEGITFFVGTEVENTKCKGQKTLFVDGIHSSLSVCELARKNGCNHIYLGANKCFSVQAPNNLLWELATTLSDEFDVTVDLPHSMLYIIPDEVKSADRIHINLSVEVPNIKSFKNITFKIDDNDFNATNPGVWVFSVDELPDNCYNDWSVYTNDEVIE